MMDTETFDALIKLIEAIVDDKISEALGRDDSSRDFLTAYDLKQNFKHQFCL
jgi:hypothetical protein